MENLSNRELELVAIGAAIGSNCRPCIIAHVRGARTAGLSDAQIAEAVAAAERVKRVPAERVLEAARAQLTGVESEARSEPQACGC
jgi:4-carboxymuconolactone decarboxylase